MTGYRRHGIAKVRRLGINIDWKKKTRERKVGLLCVMESTGWKPSRTTVKNRVPAARVARIIVQRNPPRAGVRRGFQMSGDEKRWGCDSLITEDFSRDRTAITFGCDTSLLKTSHPGDC